MSEALIAARQALVSGNSGDSEVALALIDAELAEDGEPEAVEPEAVEPEAVEPEGDVFAPPVEDDDQS